MGVLPALAAPSALAFTVQTAQPWDQSAQVAAWNSAGVYFNEANNVTSGGTTTTEYGGYLATDPNSPSTATCQTCTAPYFFWGGWGVNSNRGIFDVSPNGQYILETVQVPDTDGEPQYAAITQPGRGRDNDVYVMKASDTSQASMLTSVSNQIPPGSSCTLPSTIDGVRVIGANFPRFDHAGNKVVYAAMRANPDGKVLGNWVLVVADFSWTSSGGCLSNPQVIDLGYNFDEPYGFTPDDSGILFASSYGEPIELDAQIYTLSLQGSCPSQPSGPGCLTQISTQDESVPAYNEFAYYTPDDSAILFGSMYNSDSNDLEQWQVNPDGSNPQQLTYFGTPGSPEYLGCSYLDAGGLAFNPLNSDQYLVDITPARQQQGACASEFPSPQGEAYKITLAP